MPHHLFTVRNGIIFEKYVEMHNDEFKETIDHPSDNCIIDRLNDISSNLENMEGEVMCCKNIIWDKFNSIIDKGYILTFDYGMREKDLFYNGKKNSFMSVINNHNFYNEYFYKPGLSDITFQVDMDYLNKELTKRGYNNLIISSQRQFLYDLGLGESLVYLSKSNLKTEEIIKNRYAINQLVKPNGMGNYFVRLDSNFKKNLPFDQIEINEKYIEMTPLIEQFPQRFELPGIYNQNIIIDEEINK